MERRASDVTMLSFKRAFSIWSARQWPAGYQAVPCRPPSTFSLYLNPVHLLTLHSCSIPNRYEACSSNHRKAERHAAQHLQQLPPALAQHTSQPLRGGGGATLEEGCKGAQPPSLQPWHRMHKSASRHVTLRCSNQLMTYNSCLSHIHNSCPGRAEGPLTLTLQSQLMAAVTRLM